MARRRPDTQLAPRRRQRVGENEGTLLGQPQWGFVAAASVVEGDDPSRKLAAWLDPLQLGVGDVVAKKEARAERASTVAAYEQIDVPNVIRLENDNRSRRMRFEPFPHFRRIGGRSKWIQKQCLAPCLDARRGHERLPALTRLPGRMCETPYPQT